MGGLPVPPRPPSAIALRKSSRDPGVTAAIGLGGNLGDPRAAFALALARLAPHVTALRVSPLYRTAPVGGPPQPDFLNAAAVFRTRLAPRKLLELLLAIEAEAGRIRTAERNAPRTLDLDLLLYGDRELRERGLVVPHPRLAGRRFVLAPLADLVPRRVVPGSGRRVATLLASAPEAFVERAGGLFAVVSTDDRASGSRRGSASRSGAGLRPASRGSAAARTPSARPIRRSRSRAR